MRQIAVMVYGAPGSGKSTQAELLAKKLYLIHLNTGAYLERALHEPGVERNPVLRREQELFDEGKLCTPLWVLKIVEEAVRKIVHAGFGIVLSGSPRTLFEAFGDKHTRGIMQALTSMVGKENIFAISLRIEDEKEFVRRNTLRVVCSVCGLPVLGGARVKQCGFCAGAPRKRVLDNPEAMKTRLQEYHERTMPILEELKRQAYSVLEVDGTPPPYEVLEEIVKKIQGKRGVI